MFYQIVEEVLVQALEATICYIQDTRLSEKDKEKELNEIKDKIEYVYARGKISEQQYNLLNKKIESFVNTNKDKTSDNKSEGANETHITKRSPI